MQAAHTCRKDEEMPNDLLPSNNRAGTVSPIRGPATYQGQGCLIQSIKFMVFVSMIDYAIVVGHTKPVTLNFPLSFSVLKPPFISISLS